MQIYCRKNCLFANQISVSLGFIPVKALHIDSAVPFFPILMSKSNSSFLSLSEM